MVCIIFFFYYKIIIYFFFYTILGFCNYIKNFLWQKKRILNITFYKLNDTAALGAIFLIVKTLPNYLDNHQQLNDFFKSIQSVNNCYEKLSFFSEQLN